MLSASALEAPDQAPVHTRFALFLQTLRKPYRLTPEDEAAAWAILADQIATGPDDLSGLELYLPPLLAWTPAEQEDLRRRVRGFVEARPGLAPVELPEVEESRARVTKQRARLGAVFVAAVVAVVAVAGLAFLVPQAQNPDPVAIPVVPPKKPPPPGPEGIEWPEIPLADGVEIGEEDSVVITDPVPHRLRLPVLAFAATAPLLLALLWWVIRSAQRRSISARTGRRATDPDPALAGAFGRAGIPMDNAIRGVGARLQVGKSQEASTRLDIRATVAATARAAGLFEPCFEPERGAADYLVFIERKAPNDHLARMVDTVLDRVTAAGVTLRRFYYREDPRFAVAGGDDDGTSGPADIQEATGQNRLVVIGSSEGFFNPLTGELRDWVTAGDRPISRTLLHARTPGWWPYQESELMAQSFAVGTASPDGFAAYGAAVASGRDASGGRLREDVRQVWGSGAVAAPGLPVVLPDAGRRSWLAAVSALRRGLSLPGLRALFARAAQFATPAALALILVVALGSGGMVVFLSGVTGWMQPTGTVSPFRDCASCPEMVVIPSGTFDMGSPETEPERFPDEGPQTPVTVASFALAKTEVTFDQWAACVQGGGCEGTPEPEDYGFGRGDRPVISVSWNDAQEYVDWLNDQVEGSPYRLPSEAEWEYAVRAGEQAAYPWGATWDAASANGADAGPVQTVPVASYPANGFGLFDMIGNVWEWTEDCSHDSYANRPTDARPWLFEAGGDCDRRVARGGSWNDVPAFLRSASRLRGGPGLRTYETGFRPARTLTP